MRVDQGYQVFEFQKDIVSGVVVLDEAARIKEVTKAGVLVEKGMLEDWMVHDGYGLVDRPSPMWLWVTSA